MKDDLLITTKMPRRMFCKLVMRLEKNRDSAAEEAERFKGEEDETGKRIYQNRLNDVREIDLILGSLFGEDLS